MVTGLGIEKFQLIGHDLAFKLQNKIPDLKIIFMSGYTDDRIGKHGVLEDGINFIAKPISYMELSKKVRFVLDDN